jgi:hypothetical protein
MTDQRGLLSEGFRRVWRYQRVLWWIFFVNFALAFFGSMPAVGKMAAFTDHSLEARRISEMFDTSSFSSLTANPELKLFSMTGVSLHFALVFFVFMLFLTGGILEAYRADRKLTIREFFEACGVYFWRWVRLLILMLIVMVPVLMLVSSISGKATDLMLMSGAAREKTGFWQLIGGLGLAGVLLMCIRLWFDMTQVWAVVEEETGMWRGAWRALKFTFRNFGSLFWMYFRISVLGWLVFVAGLYVWAKMPPARFEWTILVLEFVAFWGFAIRLWQRASEMVWYQRKFLIPGVTAPVSAPPSAPPLLTIAPPA